MRIGIGLALAVALVAFAGPAPAAEQLKRHTIQGERVSVAVPTSWVAVNGRELLSREYLQQLYRDNPHLEPFLRTLTQSGSPIKFVALDPALRGGFATNLNLVSVPLPGKLTFEQYRQALAAGLQALRPIGRISNTLTRIGGKPAVRFSYQFRLTAAGRRFTVQTLQYAFLHRGKSLVFTYTTVPRFQGVYSQAFASSAKSIRFR